MEELFNSGNLRIFINDFRRGLDVLGLYMVRSLWLYVIFLDWKGFVWFFILECIMIFIL